MFLVVVAPP